MKESLKRSRRLRGGMVFRRSPPVFLAVLPHVLGVPGAPLMLAVTALLLVRRIIPPLVAVILRPPTPLACRAAANDLVRVIARRSKGLPTKRTHGMWHAVLASYRCGRAKGYPPISEATSNLPPDVAGVSRFHSWPGQRVKPFRAPAAQGFHSAVQSSLAQA
jgi:hypothetical protein